MFRRRQKSAMVVPVRGEGGGIDRRRLMRLGGRAAVGAAGAAVVGLADTSVAGAAAGQPMVLGTANDAGWVTTGLTSTVGSETLRVANTVHGTAVAATSATTATKPTVTATSGSYPPAVEATGRVVPAGGAVDVEGHGAALAVQGIVSFTRSGIVKMTENRMTVSVPGGLTWKSRVLATVQADVSVIQQFPTVVVLPDRNTGTILIQTNFSSDRLKVAWLVID